MVGYAASLTQRELGRPDVQAAIELHGVGVHDLAATGLRELEGQRRLAGRGRSDQGHYGWGHYGWGADCRGVDC